MTQGRKAKDWEQGMGKAGFTGASQCCACPRFCPSLRTCCMARTCAPVSLPSLVLFRRQPRRNPTHNFTSWLSLVLRLPAAHPRLLALQRMLSLADIEDARLRLAALEVRNPLLGTSALAQLLQVGCPESTHPALRVGLCARQSAGVWQANRQGGLLRRRSSAAV